MWSRRFLLRACSVLTGPDPCAIESALTEVLDVPRPFPPGRLGAALRLAHDHDHAPQDATLSKSASKTVRIGITGQNTLRRIEFERGSRIADSRRFGFGAECRVVSVPEMLN